MSVLPRHIPATLFAGLIALGLVIVHSVAYLGTFAFGPGFDRAMSDGGHDVYWPIFVVASVAGMTAGVVAAHSRAGFASATQPRLRARLAMAATLWAIVGTLSIAAYAVLENAEALMRRAPAPGLAALAPFERPEVAIAALAFLALVAVAALAVSTATRPYQAVLTSSYGDLVAAGRYSAGSEQPAWAAEFVSDVLRRFLAERPDAGAPPRVLECGCGTGVWLATAAHVFRQSGARLSGFDLSPAMTDVARNRLAGVSPPVEIRVGDLLDDAAYTTGSTDRYDLVFAYDVVQQLPRDLQWSAVAAMLRHVEPGGWLVVFDNDAKSRLGRTMGLKKWLRRYLRIPLVPRFYIHARYPDLKATQRRAERASDGRAEILAAPGLRKRALVLRVPGQH